MAAHLRPLRRCGQCGKPATQELYNAVNAPSGSYCDPHAAKALKAWLERDERYRQEARG
jgi:hypothetical protein